MPEPAISHHVYPNGLVLVAETMPAVRSASFSMLVPAGCAVEPEDRGGSASMLAEWITRGAGPRDGRDLLSALDNLGVTHAEGAQTIHTTVSAATLGRNLVPALGLFADILMRPHLDEDEVEPIRALGLQALQGLDDDPASKVMVELRRRHFPDPWGRSAVGTPEGVESATPDDLRDLWRRAYRPNGSILAVAGAIDWLTLRDEVGRLFGDWKARPDPIVSMRPGGPKRAHFLKETQQIQIALAYPAAPFASPDYYLARASASILGGFASARLFTEVREKRGLCYSVYAHYESLRDRAAVLCYAGTSAERAQETLDVTLAEVARLKDGGVEFEELATMRAGLKSSLIMQQESSLARSGALAGDWFYLGRVRPLAEIATALDELTPMALGEYLQRQALDEMTVVTLGPNALAMPD